MLASVQSLFLASIIYLMVTSRIVAAQSSSPCTVCFDGTPVSASLSEKLITIPWLGEFTCSALQLLVPLTIQDVSATECMQVQSLGTLCGCPERDNACRLCGRSMSDSSGSALLLSANETFVGFPDRELPFSFYTAFGGYVPNCEQVEAYLRSVDSRLDQCSFATNFVSSYCGCHYVGETTGDASPPTTAIDGPCRLCEEGKENSIHDEIKFEPFSNCWELEQAAMTFVSSGSSECVAIESLARTQGCQCQDILSSCDFCGGMGIMQFPNNTLSFLQPEFGHVPTCMEVALHYDLPRLSSESPICKDVQRMGSACGCGKIDGCGFQCTATESAISPQSLDKTLGPELVKSFETLREHSDIVVSYTCEFLQTVITSQAEGLQRSEICRDAHEFALSDCDCNVRTQCDMCGGEGTPTLPNRTMPFLKKHFGYAPTCSEFASFATQFNIYENGCLAASLFAHYCGCGRRNSCNFQCTESEVMVPRDFLDVDLGSQAKWAIELQFLRVNDPKGFDFDATCAVVESALYTTAAGSIFCIGGQAAPERCGCGSRDLDTIHYFGSKSLAQDRLLIWLTRTSAFLSIIGSLLIIIDVVRDSDKRRRLYNQIVAAMSIFDIVFSSGFAVARSAMPEDSLSFPRMYSAHGNASACRAQGFAIQLGLTSMFFNVALSIYFVYIVTYGPQQRYVKLSLYLLALPVLIGTTMALAVIPYIEPAGLYCYIFLPWYDASQWGPLLGFFLIPGSLCVLFSTLALLVVYFKVRRLHRSADDPEIGVSDESDRNGSGFQSTTSATMSRSRTPKRSTASQRTRVERDILTTAMLYLINLYACWIIWIVGTIQVSQMKSEYNYSLWAAASFLAPFQGAMNAATYFRPRWLKKWRVAWGKRRLQSLPDISSQPSRISTQTPTQGKCIRT